MCGCFKFLLSDGNLAITPEVDLVHSFDLFPFLRNELALRCTVRSINCGIIRECQSKRTNAGCLGSVD